MTFDHLTQLFTIQFTEENGQQLQKKVKRLNLVYENENMYEFEVRVKRAEEKRRVHESLVRYTGNLVRKNAELSSYNAEEVILIRPGIIERIIFLTRSGGSRVNIWNKLQNKRTLIDLTRDFLKFYRFMVIKHAFDQEHGLLQYTNSVAKTQDKSFSVMLGFINSLVLGSRKA